MFPLIISCRLNYQFNSVYVQSSLMIDRYLRLIWDIFSVVNLYRVQDWTWSDYLELSSLCPFKTGIFSCNNTFFDRARARRDSLWHHFFDKDPFIRIIIRLIIPKNQDNLKNRVEAEVPILSLKFSGIILYDTLPVR